MRALFCRVSGKPTDEKLPQNEQFVLVLFLLPVGFRASPWWRLAPARRFFAERQRR